MTHEPGGTSGTPVTEAGRRLLGEYPSKGMNAYILAIEAEAARSERERLRVMFEEEGCQAVYGDLASVDPR